MSNESGRNQQQPEYLNEKDAAEDREKTSPEDREESGEEQAQDEQGSASLVKDAFRH